MSSSGTFLTAEWRNLILLNYEVLPGLLTPFVPRGTELDSWNGRFFVSLVGFQFLNTKIFSLRFPFHSSFDEVNLRFYVRREADRETRRGVVFVREIVPRRMIALVARTFYNENYLALPMAHRINRTTSSGITAAYGWKLKGVWNEMSFHSAGSLVPVKERSLEQFITEHYWGYAGQPDGGCVEYQVTHPSWRIWSAGNAEFSGIPEKLYGPEFGEILRGQFASAFLAEGSAVSVMRGRTL